MSRWFKAAIAIFLLLPSASRAAAPDGSLTMAKLAPEIKVIGLLAFCGQDDLYRSTRQKVATRLITEAFDDEKVMVPVMSAFDRISEQAIGVVYGLELGLFDESEKSTRCSFAIRGAENIAAGKPVAP